MGFTEFRLRARRFFRQNRRILLVIFIIWAIIFLINFILRHTPERYVPSTTFEMHTSVMDTDSSAPANVRSSVEDMIAAYVDACNEGNYQKAFNMLSDECKTYAYDNKIENFMSYALTKMPLPRKFAIQDYSNMKLDKKNIYIYNVKYFDDFLATGLTNEDYVFTEDKFTFYEGKDGLEMNVGDYIYHQDVKRIAENEYMKIDVLDRTVNYSIETYTIKLTNKSQYTIVVADGQEDEEIVLQLPNEVRMRSEIYDIVLEPGETRTIQTVYKKFVDDGDASQAIILSDIRVMEKYSGTDEDKVSEETIQDEINNAIAKFSMSVSLN